MSRENELKIHHLVLTGGPCSGKTTALTRLSELFENVGWKVFRVPESAGIILGCGISFYHLNETQVEQIEEDIVKSIMTLETTCLNMAKLWDKPCIVVCDRGSMDCKAYLQEDMWQRILKKCNWNNVDLRDNRYDQVIHLVSSADGAEEFYECSQIRTEGIELAVKLDKLTSDAWIGHPNMSIIDNSTGFDEKIDRLIHCVSKQLGIKSNANLVPQKVKFLIKSLPKDEEFPRFEDFQVIEDSDLKRKQTLRKREQKNQCFYQMSIHEKEENEGIVRSKILTEDEYKSLLEQVQESRRVSYTERCFIWQNIYFHLKIYKEKLQGVIVLETETSLPEQKVAAKVAPFLQIISSVDNENLGHLDN